MINYKFILLLVTVLMDNRSQPKLFQASQSMMHLGFLNIWFVKIIKA